MNESDFKILTKDLRTLATKIPLYWGCIQNNSLDDKVNDFVIDSYAALEVEIGNLSLRQQNYHRRRWFLLKCAECDEYLFCKNEIVEHNPNRYDKEWNICINKDGQQYKFDIKGTVIPREMRGNIESLIIDPMPMIKFFYDKQSRGRRYDMQNRLFVVHHSYRDEQRELLLRCAWGTKEQVYRSFVDNIANITMYEYEGCKAQVIFIIEDKDGFLHTHIPSFPK